MIVQWASYWLDKNLEGNFLNIQQTSYWLDKNLANASVLWYFPPFNPGATVPDYVVTADDVGTFLAVDCTPMDESGRQVSC